MRWWWVLALSLSAACDGGTVADGGGAAEAADALDLGPGGAADEAGFPVTTVTPGDRREVAIAALAPGQPIDLANLDGVAHAFRLAVTEPATVVVFARTAGGDVDPYLVGKGRDGSTIATGDDQGLLPMAAETDAMVSVAATPEEEIYFVVADRNLGSAGRVTVDVVALSEPLSSSLAWTDGAVRAVNQELRDLEPELAGYLNSGALAETLDGMVETAELTEVPLRERAAINGLVSNINELRAHLYERYGEERGETAAVGRAAAELYWVARRP